jgi:hypothetical protein
VAGSEGAPGAGPEGAPADSVGPEAVTEERAEAAHLEVASVDHHVEDPGEDSVPEVAPEEGLLVEAQEGGLVVADADHTN